jgi:hypothetical protein
MHMHMHANTSPLPSLASLAWMHTNRPCEPTYFRGVAAAGKDDLCSFPYCDCWTDFNIECAEVSAPVITEANATGMMEWQSYSFTITATCDDVLRPSCGQDFYKLEFNTCESLVQARWKGAAALPGPTDAMPRRLTPLLLPFAHVHRRRLPLVQDLHDLHHQRCDPGRPHHPGVRQLPLHHPLHWPAGKR